MNTGARELPDRAWMNGRETWEGSLALGEVVVPAINVFEQPGGLPKCGLKVGELFHGQNVALEEVTFDTEAERSYFKVSAAGTTGWVSEPFISFQWSSFTFLGNILPKRACTSLDTSIQFAGMQLMLKQEGFALLAEGAPSHFDSIIYAATKFIRRLLSAQSPLSQTALTPEFTNWVEVPLESGPRTETVGFMSLEGNQPRPITNEDISDSTPIVQQMSLIPYLDLALNDFSHALNHSEHALIFLSRAIESIENHFDRGGITKKKSGKEKIMQEALGFDKSFVEYVTKRANESHRRHATKDGSIEPVPADELAECFHRTAKIIAAFSSHLSAIGI